MNNKFIVVNDKVIVLDENTTSKTVNYQNNIYEIFLKENQIEELEIINKKLIIKIDKLMDVCKKSKIWCPTSLIAETIALGVTPLVLKQIFDGEYNITVPLLGEMPMEFAVTLYTVIAFAPIFGAINISNLLDRKKSKNELNALKSMKMYVYDRLLNEQNNLETLKTTNNNNAENLNYIDGAEVYVSYDKNFNEEFNKQANFYYNAGYHARKYNKYLQKGKLEKKLHRHYSDDEIKEVKEIIKKLDLENK